MAGGPRIVRASSIIWFVGLWIWFVALSLSLSLSLSLFLSFKDGFVDFYGGVRVVFRIGLLRGQSISLPLFFFLFLTFG